MTSRWINAFVLLSSTFLFNTAMAADEVDPSPDVPEVVATTPQPLRATSRALRMLTPYGAQLQLSTLSLIVPFKPGLALTWNKSPEWTFEAGIMKGSLSAGIAGQDIASYTETSYSLSARYFGGMNHFNWLMGFSKETGSLSLGNKYVNYATGYGNIDLASINTYAVTLGLGNRWQWENGISFGVDWFTLTVPVQVGRLTSDYFNSTASQNDKDQVSDILNVFARIPRFSIAHMTVGYNF